MKSLLISLTLAGLMTVFTASIAFADHDGKGSASNNSFDQVAEQADGPGDAGKEGSRNADGHPQGRP